MAWMSVIGNCVQCGAIFNFNPDRVPSIRVSRQDGKWVPDPNGTREPVCENCMRWVNEMLVKAGREPFPVPHGAYESEEVA
jgi:hypothetical protein